MNALMAKLDRKWITLTLRHPLITTVAVSKGHCSTLPSEPVIPSKKPYKVELVGGKRYSWCTCGHSKKQPFCDGAHKTKAQGLFPLRFVPEKDATVWLCGCKHTHNPPYCDGTHKQDFIISAPLHAHTDSWKVRAALEPAIHVGAASEACTSVHLMKAAHYLLSHDSDLNLLSWHYFSHCLTETRVAMESFLFLNWGDRVSLTTGSDDMMTYHLNCVYQWRWLCHT